MLILFYVWDVQLKDVLFLAFLKNISFLAGKCEYQLLNIFTEIYRNSAATTTL